MASPVRLGSRTRSTRWVHSWAPSRVGSFCCRSSARSLRGASSLPCWSPWRWPRCWRLRAGAIAQIGMGGARRCSVPHGFAFCDPRRPNRGLAAFGHWGRSGDVAASCHAERDARLEGRRAVQIEWERDGIESTLGLDRFGGYSFLVNGKSDGSVMGDCGTQAMVALLPALLHPQPQAVFVLGLGTGMSAGWVAKVPEVTRVDVAEIEPAIAEVARRAALANHDVMVNPKVHLFQGEGASSCSLPTKSLTLSPASRAIPLCGRRLAVHARVLPKCRALLAPQGIFAQWLQGYEVDIIYHSSTLATLPASFLRSKLGLTQRETFCSSPPANPSCTTWPECARASSKSLSGARSLEPGSSKMSRGVGALRCHPRALASDRARELERGEHR